LLYPARLKVQLPWVITDSPVLAERTDEPANPGGVMNVCDISYLTVLTL
jgi:hypothetical protein